MDGEEAVVGQDQESRAEERYHHCGEAAPVKGRGRMVGERRLEVPLNLQVYSRSCFLRELRAEVGVAKAVRMRTKAFSSTLEVTRTSRL